MYILVYKALEPLELVIKLKSFVIKRISIFLLDPLAFLSQIHDPLGFFFLNWTNRIDDSPFPKRTLAVKKSEIKFSTHVGKLKFRDAGTLALTS
jgi:hypothetical protein